jgi:hypothetical protein
MEDNTPAFDPRTIGQITRDEFLVTYEIRRRLTVRTAYAECPVTLIGTNSLYPALTGYPMLNGGFFTDSAEREKNKEAVLNSAAALLLFGPGNAAGRTLTIEGAPWLVTGVMEDGDADNARVYIPARISGDGPRALLVLLNAAAGFDAAHVKNTFKPLGIHETSYHFYDLSRALRVYGERFALALRVFICALFCVFVRRQTVPLKALVLTIKNRLKQNYPGELIRKGLGGQNGKLIRFTLTILGLLGGGVFCFTLLRQGLTICLGWADMPSIAILGKGDFPAISAPLLDYYYLDALLFALCLMASVSVPLFKNSGTLKG